MSAQSIPTLISELRLRTGDDNSASYFLSDAQWTKILKTAERRLSKYVKVEDEVTVDGTGAQEYAIPTSAQNCNWSEIYIRSGVDHSTDRKLKNYDTNEGRIYLPVTISSSEKIVFWVRRPYILGVDELSDNAIELLEKLCEIEYCTYAVARRQDYVAWASLNRSDASINQLMISKQELKRDLQDYAREMGEGTEVSDFGRY